MACRRRCGCSPVGGLLDVVIVDAAGFNTPTTGGIDLLAPLMLDEFAAGEDWLKVTLNGQTLHSQAQPNNGAGIGVIDDGGGFVGSRSVDLHTAFNYGDFDIVAWIPPGSPPTGYRAIIVALNNGDAFTVDTTFSVERVPVSV